jgi:hypothetical protein
MSCRSDGDRREPDATHSQQRYWAQIEAELPPAHRHRRRIDDGRQHQKQHELWSKLQRRQTGDERQDNPSQHQKNGRGNFESFGEHRNRRDHGQQQYQHLDRRNHRPTCPQGIVTLPNRTRSNSAGTSGSRRGDDFVPCLHRRGPNGSVRSCRCKMTLDVEGVVDCCMH